MLAYVLNPDMEPVALLEDFESLEWRRPFLGAGAFRLVISQNLPSAQMMTRGLLLAPVEQKATGGAFTPDHVYLIEQLLYAVDEEGKANEWLTVTGRDISGMLDERLILPPVGLEFDERTDFAETVMKGFVTDHAGVGAALTRQLPNLVVVPSIGRGDVITYQGRYQSVLRALSEIGQEQSLGWEVSLNTTTGELEFDCLVGEDHTASGISPVFFDVELETVRGLNWTKTDLERKNLAVVAGKGDGTLRPVVTRFITPVEPTGFSRREAFVDAQDATDTAMLELKGNAFLEGFGEDIVQIDVTEHGPFLYRRDFDLGDLVTVRSAKWGLQADVQIVGISLRYAQGSPRMETSIELGRVAPTLARRVQAAGERADAGRRR